MTKAPARHRLHWVEASGDAVLYAVTTVRQKREKGGDYLYALVELAEGVRMISTVVDTPLDDLRIGDRLRAEIDETPRVVFRKEGAA